VVKFEHLVRLASDRAIVRCEDERRAVLDQHPDGPEHVVGRAAVELRGRLVGDHDGGSAGEDLAHCRSGLLTSGELGGQVVCAVRHAQQVEELSGWDPRRRSRCPGGYQEVLANGQVREEVVGSSLEYVAHRALAQAAHGPRGTGMKCNAFHHERSLRWPIHPCDQSEER
jgi:hypothetical protein